MPQIRTRGIIIRKVEVGEADRIFTLLTADRGKVRVIAKGVRRGRAKLAGYLDLLRCNDFEITEGRNLDIVTGATTVMNFGEDMDNLEMFGVKLYLCELIEKLIEEETPAHGVFELLFETLNALQGKLLSANLAKSYFEMKFLSLLGMAPQVQQSVVSHRDLSDQSRLYFSSHLGGVVAEGESYDDNTLIGISVTGIKLLRALIEWPISEVVKIKMDPGIVSEVEYISADYTGYALEYRSKTKRVMGELV